MDEPLTHKVNLNRGGYVSTEFTIPVQYKYNAATLILDAHGIKVVEEGSELTGVENGEDYHVFSNPAVSILWDDRYHDDLLRGFRAYINAYDWDHVVVPRRGSG